MTCRVVERRLAQDLQMAELESVAAHLKECPECRQLLADLRALEELADAEWPLVQAPPGFEDQVIREIRRSEDRRRLFRVAAAVLVTITLAGFSYWFNAPAQESSVRSASVPPSSPSPRITPELIVPLPYESEWTHSGTRIRVVESDELPSAIEIQDTRLHRELYLKNVSH